MDLSVFKYFFRALRLPVSQQVFLSLAALIGSINLFLFMRQKSWDLYINPNPLHFEPPRTFDFIIVGAGSAGGVVANKLSANGKYRVLLLEAGFKPSVMSEIPYLTLNNLGQQFTDWVYPISPQKNSCFGLKNNSFIFNRGKSLGGSGNLNTMTYMRGNPKDFDGWAELTGDSQWSYENVLPYFKKFENYHGNYSGTDEFHGHDGPILITTQTYQPMVEDWINAGKELGFSVRDPNAGQSEFFGPRDAFTANGKRWETYQAYIEPASHRHNLEIITFAQVTKINLDSNKKATGVTYVRNGQTITVLASKEVILSAGSIGSPHLLMVSGIGPEDHLRSVGVHPIVDLPGVGKHLQDHVAIMVGPFLLNETTSFFPERNISYEAVHEYLFHKTGPLTFVIDTALALISTTGDATWPNVALQMSPSGISESLIEGTAVGLNVKDGVFQAYVGDQIGKDANFVKIVLGRPASSGEITLNSKDPFVYPTVNPNYFAEPSDVKALVEAFKFTVKLYEETKAYGRYNAKLISKHFPGCEQFPLKSDEYYECYIRQFTGTVCHPSATCKMGRIDDPLAVVDSNLRVRNVGGLRVVDSSIFPEIPNSNLNAPTIMIAEKVSDIILKAWEGYDDVANLPRFCQIWQKVYWDWVRRAVIARPHQVCWA